jgi:peroxiredoxin
VHALLIVALVLPWVLVAVLLTMLLFLLKQHGDFLHAWQTNEVLHQRAADREAGIQADTGLEVGTQAPELVLSDLQGGERSLAEYRGSPFVVGFFSTACGHCQRMAPRLARLPEGAPPLVLVAAGGAADLQALADEHGWRCDVLLDDELSGLQAFESMGTPSGYLVDAEGRIATKLALGPDAVLALLEPGQADVSANGHGSANGREGSVVTAESLREKEVEAVERARTAGVAARGTSESRIGRDGLKAGVLAPTFVLPDVDGTMHSLADYRGRRVLLVFSDVNCGPCEALAPDLVALANERDDVQVVMISRGGAEANRAKREQHGYSFPVLVQKSWEVSKQYEMFATPIGFLIDEDGVIAKDVGLGRGILELVR